MDKFEPRVEDDLEQEMDLLETLDGLPNVVLDDDDASIRPIIPEELSILPLRPPSFW